MRALPDVTTVEFDIPTETLTVDLADRGTRNAVLAAIKALGYKPRVLDAAPAETETPSKIKTPRAASLNAALRRAGRREVPLVVNCGGEFCPAYQAFKRNVLADSRVRAALRAFEVLEVDVTRDEVAASHLGVTAVPDVWILSGDGTVLTRENRTMDVAAFLEVLGKHLPR